MCYSYNTKIHDVCGLSGNDYRVAKLSRFEDSV